MKKLITFITFLAICLSLAVFAENGPFGRSRTLDGTGSVKGPADNFFINVRNVSGVDASNGSVMVMNTATDNGYEVVMSASAGAVPICVMAEACSENDICSCQTYGLHTSVDLDTTNLNSGASSVSGGVATAGQQAFIGENLRGWVQSEKFASVAATDRPIGIFMDTTAHGTTSSGNVEVFIQLR